MKLSLTRAIIDAIHNGTLAKAPTQKDPVFGFEVITECPGVPSEVLIPRNTWADKAGYDAAANKLATLFINNFKTYAAGASEEVCAAGPVARS
jgi:phosphoenolpyruvate carboxykinase (ATP)